MIQAETMQKAKAVLLYRASSKKQTDSENDIPLQRDILKPWCEQQGYEFYKELVEGGVSGYKVSADDRDAIQEIKRMADNKEFDVLLIYMSDRLGRLAQETPLIMSYLNSKGIRIFSYREGEITTNTHTDQLMTYIRYWQAQGESMKTSMRVADAMESSVRNGKWRGGIPPFGYRSVSRGTLNYKGKPIFDVEIHPEQAAVVKKIFEMYSEEHCGARHIAKHLNDKCILTLEGKEWSGALIMCLLKKRIYTGVYVLHSKSKNKPLVESPFMPHLAIIDQVTFDRAQRVRIESTTNNCEGTQRRTNHGKQLLSGLLQCGECGDKLTSHLGHSKKIRKDGSIHEYARHKYRCRSHTKPKERKEVCHLKNYLCDEIDKEVIADARAFIKESDRKKLLETTEATIGGQLKTATDKAAKLSREIARVTSENAKLKETLLKTLMGESAYPEDVLTEMLATKKTEITDLTEKLEMAEKERAEIAEAFNAQKEFAENIDTWETRFDAADATAKKSMLLNIIDKIMVYPKKLIVTYKMEVRRFATLEPIALPNWLDLPTTDGMPPSPPQNGKKSQDCNVNTHFFTQEGAKGSQLATSNSVPRPLTRTSCRATTKLLSTIKTPGHLRHFLPLRKQHRDDKRNEQPKTFARADQVHQLRFKQGLYSARGGYERIAG